jgi:hypothetical protein
LRSIVVVASNPALVRPNGSVATPLNVTASSISLDLSRIVRLPQSENSSPPLASIRVLSKVSFGKRSMSRKSGLRRWLSRSLLAVSIEAASI